MDVFVSYKSTFVDICEETLFNKIMKVVDEHQGTFRTCLFDENFYLTICLVFPRIIEKTEFLKNIENINNTLTCTFSPR